MKISQRRGEVPSRWNTPLIPIGLSADRFCLLRCVNYAWPLSHSTTVLPPCRYYVAYVISSFSFEANHREAYAGALAKPNHTIPLYTKLTRKLCYRKDDRAMRPIYGCPDCRPTPTAAFQEIFTGLLFRSIL